MMRTTALLLSILLVCFSGTASAHAPASSYLMLDLASADTNSLTADLALGDVAQLLPLDSNGDGELSWGELRANEALLYTQIQNALALQRGGESCSIVPQVGQLALVTYSATPHVSARFSIACPQESSEVGMQFDLFSVIDPKHRVISRVVDASTTHLRVTTAEDAGFVLDITESASAYTMLREGVVHILGGYDHLLFLFLLIIPTIGMHGIRRRLWRLLGIVTAFTAAHSITLALAALGYVSLPSQWVEVAIAASIVVAGLINVLRPEHHIGWQLAFGFGLLHGFGFAGALAELGLGGNQLLLQLFAFNVGVEIGQIAVVLASLPLFMAMSLLPRYRKLLVPLMSAGGAGMGIVWVASRL
ncbi:MAG: HupE/UreJ family protein [Woeseia sp.]|nr:HupE/UreJ family protein [Woeseia sp.]